MACAYCVASLTLSPACRPAISIPFGSPSIYVALEKQFVAVFFKMFAFCCSRVLHGFACIKYSVKCRWKLYEVIWSTLVRLQYVILITASSDVLCRCQINHGDTKPGRKFSRTTAARRVIHIGLSVVCRQKPARRGEARRGARVHDRRSGRRSA